MKKLYSAAVATVMAASMVGTAVPFTAGAADASKTLEVRAYENASTSIDTTSADVTVPVGLYIVESTNDCQTISSKITVHSKDGDASAVKFSTLEPGASTGVTKSYTIDGETVESDILVNFAGKAPSIRRSKVQYSATGSIVTDADANGDPVAGETNNVASVAWATASDGTGYKWTGEKSDSYPIFVVNVTFPKGTKSGTYTIDFLDYLKDAKYPEIYSNLIEVGGTKYSTKNSNLNLKGGLEIKVNGGGAAVTPTEAPATAAPATAAPATAAPATAAPATAAPVQQETGALPVNSGFTLKPEKDVYEVKAGNTIKDVCLFADSNGAAAGMYALEFGQLPAGFTMKNPADVCDAAENKAWKDLNGIYYCDSINGGDPIVPSTEDPLFYFDLEVASTVADGEYTIPIKRLDVIESKDKSYGATVTNVKVKVSGGSAAVETTAAQTPVVQPTTAQTPVVQPTTAAVETPTGALPVNNSFTLKPEKDNYTVKAGESLKDVCLFADSNGASAGMYALEFGQLPAGFTMSNPADVCEAAENKAWKDLNGIYYCDSINGGDPIKPSTEDPFFYFDLKVADTVAAGEYTIPIVRLDVIESKDKSYGAAVTNIKVTVTSDATAAVEPTTVKVEPTTVKVDPTPAAQPTTAEQTPVANTTAPTLSDAVYGDVDCNGKVNIADVVILNKYLTDASSITVSAQGLLNADCCDPTGKSTPDFTDSKAIIKSIVHLVTLPAKSADLK